MEPGGRPDPGPVTLLLLARHKHQPMMLMGPRFNHRPKVERGLLREECAALLVDFFSSRR